MRRQPTSPSPATPASDATSRTVARRTTMSHTSLCSTPLNAPTAPLTRETSNRRPSRICSQTLPTSHNREPLGAVADKVRLRPAHHQHTPRPCKVTTRFRHRTRGEETWFGFCQRRSSWLCLLPCARRLGSIVNALQERNLYDFDEGNAIFLVLDYC